MKRLAAGLVVGLLSVAALSAQSTYDFETAHYRVTSEVSQDHARQTALRMEALMELFNAEFRFAAEQLATPLRVRVFATQSRYDSYIQRILGTTREGFVYLHYEDIEKSELVGYYALDDRLEASQVHQAFVQFFRAFIANPPLWMREGFAVYYESTAYDPEFRAAVYRENLAWLDTLKSVLERDDLAFTIDDLLLTTPATVRDNLDVFYPLAWGVVSFLANAPDPDINRILWDAISALEPSATLEANIANVEREAFSWIAPEQLSDEFRSYVASRRSFAGWIDYAIDAYNDGRTDEAERGFLEAIRLSGENAVPYYYLGLLNYGRENHGLAEFYYEEALTRGAEEALTLYALGVNAYADNRFEDAIVWLELAVDRDASYRDRAENLLVRIRD